MPCLECGLEFDEMNESQPVCPGCGAPADLRGDEFALIGEINEVDRSHTAPESGCAAELGFVEDESCDVPRLPPDLCEAADEAEGMLEATGLTAFLLPDGFRLFRLPTERVM